MSDDLLILDIYFDRRLVQDKDGNEFEIFRGKDYDLDWKNLGFGYSKDDKRIYHLDEIYFTELMKNIDLPSFEAIESNKAQSAVYFKDKNSIYIDSYMCDKCAVLEQANPSDFKIIDIEKGYAISGETCYWFEEKLPYPFSELKRLSSCYQKVGDSIYCGHTTEMACDVDTFEVVHSKVSTIAKDKNNVYFKDEVVEGVNPEAFQFLEECVGEDAEYYTDCDIHFYAKDDRYAYFVNEIFGIKTIKTKDLESFTFIVEDKIGYGRDSSYLYEKGKRRRLK